MKHQLEAVESRRLFAAGFASGSAVAVPFVGYADVFEAQPTQVLAAPDGSTFTVTNGLREESFIGVQIRKVTADGKIDRTFAKGRGRINFAADPSRTVIPHQAALDGEGRLYVLNNVNKVTRYTADGRLDTTYTGDGTTTLSGFVAVNDIMIDRQDRLWVNGSRGDVAKNTAGTQTRNVTAFTVARVTADGVYDKTFAVNGVFAEALPVGPNVERKSEGRGLRLLGDGSVIATAEGSYDTTAPDTDPATSSFEYVEAVKFRANGRTDTAYGRRGRAYYTTGLSSTYTGDANAGVIRGDGSVVVRVQTAVTQSGRSGTTESLAQITAAGQTSATPPTGQLTTDGVTAVRADGYVVTAVTDTGTARTRIKLTAATRQPVPTAALVGRTLKAAAGSLKFSVVYGRGVDSGTIGGDDIFVANADGDLRAARVFSRETLKNGTVQVQYRVTNPGGGSGFTRADNGSYAVVARTGGVTDTSDNDLPAQALGTLRVRIA